MAVAIATKTVPIFPQINLESIFFLVTRARDSSRHCYRSINFGPHEVGLLYFNSVVNATLLLLSREEKYESCILKDFKYVTSYSVAKTIPCSN